VADICERVIVLYAGQVVEQADLTSIFREPLHPYTEALLESNPHNVRGAAMLAVIPGGVPTPGAWPAGCHFHPRCRYATDECTASVIALSVPAPGRQTRCVHHDLLRAGR